MTKIEFDQSESQDPGYAIALCFDMQLVCRSSAHTLGEGGRPLLARGPLPLPLGGRSNVELTPSPASSTPPSQPVETSQNSNASWISPPRPRLSYCCRTRLVQPLARAVASRRPLPLPELKLELGGRWD